MAHLFGLQGMGNPTAINNANAPGQPNSLFPETPSVSANSDISGFNPIDYSSALSQLSQDFANKQMEFQKEQSAQAMEFNRSEAQKNRDWQEHMSATSHQRAVEDLKKAGLNPILAAGQGSPMGSGSSASVGMQSGAMGQVDMSGTSAILGFMAQDKTNKNALEIAKMQVEQQLYSTDVQAKVQMLGQQLGYKGVELQAWSSRFNTQLMTTTQQVINNNNIAWDEKKQAIQNNFTNKLNWRDNIFDTGNTAISSLSSIINSVLNVKKFK